MFSVYRYPHIVLSCDDEEKTAAYSPVYGRLLIDRVVTDGFLEETGDHTFVPKQDVENELVEGFYSYPETHVTIHDLRNENLHLRMKLCTDRGMNCESYTYTFY